MFTQHEDLELQFNPAGGGFRFFSSTQSGFQETPFFEWLSSKLSPGDISRELRYQEDWDNGDAGVFLTEQRGRDTVFQDRWYSVTPTLENTANVSEEIYGAVISALGLADTEVKGSYTQTAREMSIASNGHSAHTFDIDDNFNEDAFGHFGGGFLRETLELLHPEFLTGSDIILYNTSGEVVTDPSLVNDIDVIDVDGINNTYNLGQGDSTVALFNTDGSTINGGGGMLNVLADGTQHLNITDIVAREGNASIVTFTGDNQSIDHATDEGINAIVFEDGTTSNYRLNGDGTISVELQNGADVSESTFSFDETDGQFVAQDGSKLSFSEVFGGDGDDRFVFGGESIGNTVRTGDGNDYITINSTFEGDFDLSDSAAAWAWANDDETNEFDVVALQGEGWELLELDDQTSLIARDENDNILAQINLSGDSKRLESIYTFDSNGRIADLQSIDPEIRYKLAFLKPVSQVLLALGTVFPPAAIAGAVTKFAYDAANNQVSFRNAVTTGVQVAGAYGAPAYVAPAVNAGFAASDGNWSQFAQNLVLTAAGVEASIEGVPLQEAALAKVANGVEAALITVEGFDSGSPFEIAEGIFLLGSSITQDGTLQSGQVGDAVVGAIFGGDLVSQRLTGQSQLKVAFAPLNEAFMGEYEVDGLNPLNPNERITIVYGDDDTPLALLNSAGFEIGRVEQALDGSTNFYRYGEDGSDNFIFNYNSETDTTSEEIVMPLPALAQHLQLPENMSPKLKLILGSHLKPYYNHAQPQFSSDAPIIRQQNADNVLEYLNSIGWTAQEIQSFDRYFNLGSVAALELKNNGFQGNFSQALIVASLDAEPAYINDLNPDGFTIANGGSLHTSEGTTVNCLQFTTLFAGAGEGEIFDYYGFIDEISPENVSDAELKSRNLVGNPSYLANYDETEEVNLFVTADALSRFGYTASEHGEVTLGDIGTDINVEVGDVLYFVNPDSESKRVSDLPDRYQPERVLDEIDSDIAEEIRGYGEGDRIITEIGPDGEERYFLAVYVQQPTEYHAVPILGVNTDAATGETVVTIGNSDDSNPNLPIRQITLDELMNEYGYTDENPIVIFSK